MEQQGTEFFFLPFQEDLFEDRYVKFGSWGLQILGPVKLFC